MAPFDTESTDRMLSTTCSVRPRLDFEQAYSLIPDDYLQMCLIPVADLPGNDLKPPVRKDSDETFAWDTWG